MNEQFLQKYKCYENFPIERLKHIPAISFYNHNYYFGIKREGDMVPDMIYVETNELAGVSEYYHKNGEEMIHIGYAYEGDEFITLQKEELI